MPIIKQVEDIQVTFPQEPSLVESRKGVTWRSTSPATVIELSLHRIPQDDPPWSTRDLRDHAKVREPSRYRQISAKELGIGGYVGRMTSRFLVNGETERIVELFKDRLLVVISTVDAPGAEAGADFIQELRIIPKAPVSSGPDTRPPDRSPPPSMTTPAPTAPAYDPVFYQTLKTYYKARHVDYIMLARVEWQKLTPGLLKQAQVDEQTEADARKSYVAKLRASKIPPDNAHTSLVGFSSVVSSIASGQGHPQGLDAYRPYAVAILEKTIDTGTLVTLTGVDPSLIVQSTQSLGPMAEQAVRDEMLGMVTAFAAGAVPLEWMQQRYAAAMATAAAQRSAPVAAVPSGVVGPAQRNDTSPATAQQMQPAPPDLLKLALGVLNTPLTATSPEHGFMRGPAIEELAKANGMTLAELQQLTAGPPRRYIAPLTPDTAERTLRNDLESGGILLKFPWSLSAVLAEVFFSRSDAPFTEQELQQSFVDGAPTLHTRRGWSGEAYARFLPIAMAWAEKNPEREFYLWCALAAMNPTDAGVLQRVAILHKVQGKHPVALHFITRSVQLKPTADGWFERGSLLMALGRRDEASADVMRAAQLDPATYTAHLQKMGLAIT
jgi:hypothetical protein